MFKTDYDLISQITRGVQDDEDVVIDISEVKVINLSSTAEAESTTNATNYRGRVLSSGEYNVTLMVVDSRGAFDRKVVTFHIDDDTTPTHNILYNKYISYTIYIITHFTTVSYI